MNYSKLLGDILSRTSHLDAPGILAAMAHFCALPYQGLSPYDAHIWPEPFEEERLRLAFGRVFRASPGLMAAHLGRRGWEETAPYEDNWSFAPCQETAEHRGKDILSADLVFLAAVQALAGERRSGVNPPFRGSFSLDAAMADLDRDIFDYVIRETGRLRDALDAKAQSARAMRDWHPAQTFVQPEEFARQIAQLGSWQTEGNVLELTIPAFFGLEGEALRLSILRADGVYHIQDNGCALAHLRRRTGWQSVPDWICHPMWVWDGRVLGQFDQTHHFFTYLQYLIFIAHADLVLGHMEQPIYPWDSLQPDFDLSRAEPFDPRALVDDITRRVSTGYDPNRGMYVSLGAPYRFSSTWASFLVETLGSRTVRISDNLKGLVEGEILEGFYWDNADPGRYAAFIQTFCARFDAQFDGKNLSLTAPCGQAIPALLRFANLAVLLSELGQRIRLPETSE